VKLPVLIALALGAGAFTALLAYEGAGEVLGTFALAGWGVLAVAAFHLVPLLLDSSAMGIVLERPVPYRRIARARWIGEAVNGLLPVAQMGGPMVMARLLARYGTGRADAGAAVVVSTTQQMLSQAAFGILGMLALAAHANDGRLLWPLLIGTALFGGNAVWFYSLQKRGLFARLAKMLNRFASGREWLDFSGGAEALDAAVQGAYARPRVGLNSFLLNLAGWLAGIGEVWLVLFLLGHPVSLLNALMLESLGQAIRGIAFAIPGALGVQEGGYVLLGALIGLDAPTALALSLMKRARELLLGIPALVYWQYLEGRWLRRRLRPAAPTPDQGS